MALAAAIIEHCLHPRALLSPMDADFCAQIIKVIHAQGTPNWSTIHIYDKVRYIARDGYLHLRANGNSSSLNTFKWYCAPVVNTKPVTTVCI